MICRDLCPLLKQSYRRLLKFTCQCPFYRCFIFVLSSIYLRLFPLTVTDGPPSLKQPQAPDSSSGPLKTSHSILFHRHPKRARSSSAALLFTSRVSLSLSPCLHFTVDVDSNDFVNN